jgi:hypothetical protein
VRLGHDQAASSTSGITHRHTRGAVDQPIAPNLAVANHPIMRVNRRRYTPRQPSLPTPPHPHAPRVR